MDFSILSENNKENPMTLEQIIEKQGERICMLEEQMKKMMAHTHEYNDHQSWTAGKTSEPKYGDEE